MENMCWINPARRVGQSDKEERVETDRRPGRAGEQESLRKADRELLSRFKSAFPWRDSGFTNWILPRHLHPCPYRRAHLVKG